MRGWCWVLGVLLMAAQGCGDDTGEEMPDAGGACRADEECDDGDFCNGHESCDPMAVDADGRGCVRSSPPCLEGQDCEAESAQCITDCSITRDADGDGSDAAECGGDDCDDADANRFAGNPEVCDGAGHDEDCDASTFGDTDADADGFIDAACCNTDEDASLICGTDCDDSRSDVSPNTVETCDERDNDCDGSVDEGVLVTWYEDADGDGFASREPDAAMRNDCVQPNGFAAMRTDCDDTEASANPGAPEVCDGNDNDCDDTTDENTVAVSWYRDADEDTFGVSSATPIESCEPVPGHVTRDGDCDDNDAAVNPLAEDICDGIDNDCDGLLEGEGEDVDGDGFASASCGGEDCDDTQAAVYPGAPEACNRMDDDCSSGGGEDASEDQDDDGHSPPTVNCPAGGFPRDDCDDARANAHGGAVEICNRLDDDCGSGGGNEPDEDFDRDGFAPVDAPCTGGFPKTDCDDSNPDLNPGQADICDLALVDENCSGVPNETCPSGLWADPDALDPGVLNPSDCEPGYAMVGLEVRVDGAQDFVRRITALCEALALRQTADDFYEVGWNEALWPSNAPFVGGGGDEVHRCPPDYFMHGMTVHYHGSSLPSRIRGIGFGCVALRAVNMGGEWTLESDPARAPTEVLIETTRPDSLSFCEEPLSLMVGLRGMGGLAGGTQFGLESRCAIPRLRLGQDGGCADTTRDGFADELEHPDIAACGGGWGSPGLRGQAPLPLCARNSGDDIETPPALVLCSAADLCAEGWHICEDAADVAASEPSGCASLLDEIPGTPPPQFWATAQGGDTGMCTPTGTDDIYGCAVNEGDPVSCDPLTHSSGDQCAALGAAFGCPDASDEIGSVTRTFVPAETVEAGGVLCCRD